MVLSWFIRFKILQHFGFIFLWFCQNAMNMVCNFYWLNFSWIYFFPHIRHDSLVPVPFWNLSNTILLFLKQLVWLWLVKKQEPFTYKCVSNLTLNIYCGCKVSYDWPSYAVLTEEWIHRISCVVKPSFVCFFFF